MKTENKLIELKTAACDATIAKQDAEYSRDLAWRFYRNADNTDNTADTDLGWDAYVAAKTVFMDARAASQRAGFAYVAYKEYLEGLKSTDNTEDK